MNRGPDTSEQTAEQRVSTIAGDRLCVGCGYNLTGQPIVREAHYRMLIARCPECGTVASLQEYPTLGRWARRWAAVLAAGWMIVLLALMLASAGILAGLSAAAADSAVKPWAVQLMQLQRDDFERDARAGNLPQSQQWMVQSMFPAGFLDNTWLQKQDLTALLQSAGGAWAVADVAALRLWIWIAIAAFAIGCVWAVALLQLPRRRLPLVGVVPLLLAGVFLALAHLGDSAGAWAPGLAVASQVASRQIGAPWKAASLLFAALPLAAGLMLGRPIARGLVLALLPPRLRGPLALLWIAEGLQPPPART